MSNKYLYSYILPFCFLILFTACSSKNVDINKNSYRNFQNLTFFVAKYGVIKNNKTNQYLNRVKDSLQSVFDASKCLTNVNVVVINTNESLALTPTRTDILISKGLIKSLNSESELAFILAHELSHIYYCHPLEEFDDNQIINKEIQADKLAIKVISKLKYSQQSAISALSHAYARVAKSDISIYEDNKSHPILERRIKIIGELIDSKSRYRNHQSKDFLLIKKIL